MNESDALRLMIEFYPGGREVVCLRLGKPWSTLDKELRNAPGYKLGSYEARRISVMCNEVDSPYALAWLTVVASESRARVGRCEIGDDGDADLYPLASASVREVADVATVIFGSKPGAEQSPNGRKRMQKEITEAIDALQKLQRAVDAAGTKAVRRG